jgi:hypothetical protein
LEKNKIFLIMNNQFSPTEKYLNQFKNCSNLFIILYK